MRSVVASHGPGSNPRGNAICNAILLESFPVLQTFGLQYFDRHLHRLRMPKNLKISKSTKTGPTSHIGPKTSRAARDRPEPNPRRNQPSRHRRSGGRPAAAPPRRKLRAAAARTSPINTHSRATICACCASSIARPAASSRKPSSSSAPPCVEHRPPSNERRATSTAEARDKARQAHGRGMRQVRQAHGRGARQVSRRIVKRSPAMRVQRACTARVHACGGAPPCAAASRRFQPEISFDLSEKLENQIQYGIIVLIRSENLGSDTTVGIRITPPGEAAKEQNNHVPGDDQYDTTKQFYDIGGAPPCAAASRRFQPEISFDLSEKLENQIQYGIIVLIRSENLGSDTTVGIRITPPGEAAKEQNNHVPGDDQYDTTKQFYDIHRVFWKIPCWQLVPGSNRNYKNAGSSRDTASRGPTTIAAPESQFRTCPTDHDSIGYPRMSASGESLTTMHRLLHASGSHPIPRPYDPKTNKYNQDLGLIHSTNGNHLESPNEGSSIDHQLLFTEAYLLRLPVVEDSDWSKSGSAGLFLPRRFFLYHFRRLGLSWKKIAEGATLCSLLAGRLVIPFRTELVELVAPS
ncbi:hypothetical protein F511_16188 [Dorcoceras hygrometricum]|uniref:Uncharacterized protein n=1 Tax=Dorcoceras hygrometricum TaxID=472368 RepID=A0A2Z7CDF1_9LAMI|nr:hypothetical protein F511_16188 [Dorcoceras hygrometricum]